jgi:Uma2 family endonuclease
MSTVRASSSEVVYPDSDGEPMSDNTLQWDTIAYLVHALRHWFKDRADVFVAGDLLWYYREGDPKKRIAPDGLVAFGRPAGYRGSYKQWEEGGVAPHVVFEVLSPNNTAGEMMRKYALYAELGCLEYYLIDPDNPSISGFVRRDNQPEYIEDAIGFRSPQLGLRMVFEQGLFAFLTTADNKIPTMLEAANRAQVEQERADGEKARADGEKARADDEKARADDEEARADAAVAAVERLRQRMLELGIDPGV